MEYVAHRTSLYSEHKTLGGKLVVFAGWKLPVQYSGVIPEHNAVRKAAGMFDVSHMGEVWITGPEALKMIDALTCNDVKKIVDGRAQYNAIINPKGGVVDDIIVYRFSSERFFICLNAANTAKDIDWFRSHNKFNAQVQDVSSEFGQIALQGPLALKILGQLAGGEALTPPRAFSFTQGMLLGMEVIVARTGYTGEDGVEIFCPWDRAPELWRALLAAGQPLGLLPAGLGARDSLRLEACYPLHGHELSDEISAIESGLGWITKPEKGPFMGRDILAAQKQNGAPRSLVGLFLDEAGIARDGSPVLNVNGERIGAVTSGTKTPTVNRALGLALIDSEFKAIGTQVYVLVRDKRLKASVVPTPFYKRPA